MRTRINTVFNTTTTLEFVHSESLSRVRFDEQETCKPGPVGLVPATKKLADRKTPAGPLPSTSSTGLPLVDDALASSPCSAPESDALDNRLNTKIKCRCSVMLFILLLIFVIQGINARDNTLIYRVAPADNCSRISYLHGTVHLLPKGYNLPPLVNDYLAGCRIFVMEADLSGLNPGMVQEFFMYPEGQNLKDLYSDNEWNEISELGLMLGISETKLKRMKPEYLSQVAITKEAGDYAMDSELSSLALSYRKRFRFLETAKEQLQLFAKIPDKEEREQLLELARGYNTGLADLRKLQQHYLSGDIKKLHDFLFRQEELEKYPETYRVLFSMRNSEWLPQITSYIDEGSAFIAVGAGHLLGEKGLVNLLKIKGYRIVRINI